MTIRPSTLLAAATLFAGAAFVAPQQADAHCQIPCGIYDDSARVSAMLEDATTVSKATSMIAELEGKTDAQSQQQMIRWVTNKEDHAQKIISTIADYFLTQRVKSSQDDYVQRLKDHHGVIVAAMKAKQNAGAEHADALASAIRKLQAYYPHTHSH